MCVRAAEMTIPATADGAPAPALPDPPSPSVTFVGRPRAPSVCGPAIPSTARPCVAWNCRTAARVIGP